MDKTLTVSLSRTFDGAPLLTGTIVSAADSSSVPIRFATR